VGNLADYGGGVSVCDSTISNCIIWYNKVLSKYGNIHRMDRILKAEGTSPDKYKVAKQADTLMLFYLFSPEEVVRLLKLMGYKIKNPRSFIKKNFDYYVKRTSHGSTLSHVVHAAILKYLPAHENEMWERFMSAMKSDIYDTQGGTTVEGIHCGVMAGTIDIVIKTFAGISLAPDYIEVDPQLPAHWKNLTFKILRNKTWYKFDFTEKKITIELLGDGHGVDIRVGKKIYKFKNKKVLNISIGKK